MRPGFSISNTRTNLGGGVAAGSFGSGLGGSTFHSRSGLNRGSTFATARSGSFATTSGSSFATAGRSLIAACLHAATVATSTTLFTTAQLAAGIRLAASRSFATARGGSSGFATTSGSSFTWAGSWLAAGSWLTAGGLAARITALGLATAEQTSLGIHRKACQHDHSGQHDQ